MFEHDIVKADLRRAVRIYCEVITSAMEARVIRAIYPMPYKAMVITGKVKLAKVTSSIAERGPLNHFKPTAELENTTIKITPDTYSGVAVVIIEFARLGPCVSLHACPPKRQ